MRLLKLIPNTLPRGTHVRLQLGDGHDGSSSFVVDRLPAIIGRGEDADLLIDDRFVSQVHCLLNYSEGALVVQDLESRNGTKVNGRRVKAKWLEEGDAIDVGATRIHVVKISTGDLK